MQEPDAAASWTQVLASRCSTSCPYAHMARCPLGCSAHVAQEPDTAASAAQALISLVAKEERYFPLGFAYGHIRDAAVRFLCSRSAVQPCIGCAAATRIAGASVPARVCSRPCRGVRSLPL